MSAAEAPKSEQIQANVAAALSRLRGELGASSSPVAGTAQNPVPKTPSDPAEPSLGMPSFGSPNLGGGNLGAPNLTPLPAGPVRLPDLERPSMGSRPFEPTLGAALGTLPGAGSAIPTNDDAPIAAAPEPDAEAPKADLFGRMRHEPVLKAEREPSADAQPDLLSGMEVPPAPPPPLGSFAVDDEVAGRGKRMRNRLLALLVLGIVAGGAGWAYLSSNRSADGPVPVITADATPEKVKPTDEGGMQVPNQNVQILDNMSGQAGDQGQGQENLLPPPEQPVAPPAVDAAAPATPAVTEDAAAASNAPSAVDQPAVPSVPAPAIPAVPAPEPGQTASSAAEPPVTQQAAPEPSVPEPTAQAPAEPAVTASAPAAPAATPEPAKTEPATQTAAAPAAPAATPAPAAGGVRIQLAAVKSEAAAKTQWAKLQKAHPDLLGGLTLKLQTVDKAGVTYYRIQAGPLASKSAAKALCTKLAAQKQDCIVAK